MRSVFSRSSSFGIARYLVRFQVSLELAEYDAILVGLNGLEQYWRKSLTQLSIRTLANRLRRARPLATRRIPRTRHQR